MGQGMESGLELRAQQGVHRPMAGHQVLSGESLADHQELEVGLRTFGDRVHVALVHHLQVQGGEGVADSGFDSGTSIHLVIP